MALKTCLTKSSSRPSFRPFSMTDARTLSHLEVWIIEILLSRLIRPILRLISMRFDSRRIRFSSTASISSRYLPIVRLQTASAVSAFLIDSLLRRRSARESGVSCGAESLSAAAGLQWASSISPSTPRSTALWEISSILRSRHCTARQSLLRNPQCPETKSSLLMAQCQAYKS